MATTQIDIEGLGELRTTLEQLGRLDVIEYNLLAAGQMVEGKMKIYPPPSIANSPSNPTGYWYERGYGSRWWRADGTMGGRKTSERLKEQWTVEPLGRTAVQVGNKVTYGPFVQDAQNQQWFHRMRGWQTIQTVAEQEKDRITNFLRTQIERWLAGRSG